MMETKESDKVIETKIPEWVIDSGVLESFRKLDYAVAVITTRYGPVGLYANPADQQCYRLIARLLVDKPEDIRLNEIQSLEESLAVSTAVAVLKQVVFKHSGLFVQSLHLGNNSMQFDAKSSAGVGLGTLHEPYFYHEHLLLRAGDPDLEYLEGAGPIGGPPIGTSFTAQGVHAGKSTKQLAAFVNCMKKVLDESRADKDWKKAECSLNDGLLTRTAIQSR